MKIDITVERKPYGLLLSTIHNGEFFKFKYIDYSVREAKKKFRQHVREQIALAIRSH